MRPGNGKPLAHAGGACGGEGDTACGQVVATMMIAPAGAEPVPSASGAHTAQTVTWANARAV